MQSLRDAVRSVADANLGFVYTDDEAMRERIAEEYTKSADLGILDSASVTEEDVTRVLDELENAEKQREQVYFINPFERAQWDEEPLLAQLEQAFKDSPFLTSEQLRKEIEALDLNMAIREVSPLFDALIDEGYVKPGLSSTGNTRYYKAGQDLMEHRLIDLEPLSKRLQSAATAGIVTRSELERVLTIPVDDGIIKELKRKNAIRQLSDAEFLVDEPATRKAHVENQVDERFVRAVERAFREADFILSEAAYHTVLTSELDERSNILQTRLDPEEEDSIIDVVDAKVRQLGSFNFERIGPHANDYDLEVEEPYVRLAGESRQYIVQQAEAYISRAADGSLPADDRHFIQNDVLPEVDAEEFTDSTDEVVQRFYEEQVRNECREIGRTGRIEEVITND